MRQALRLLYYPFKLVIIAVCSPILTAVYWVLAFTVGIPLFVFKRFLFLIVRLLDPDIDKPVDSMGQLLSRDFEEWYVSPSHPVIVLCKLQGKQAATLDQVRRLFLQRVVHRSDINHDKLEYPEMQQYFTKRLGYLFYKWDRTFDISNHVNFYYDKELLSNPETDVVDQQKLMLIWETLLTKPFREKRSPWDVYFVPNFEPNGKEESDKKCVVILRVQHGLCDGIAVYKLLLSFTDTGLKDLEKNVIAFRPSPPCFDVLLHLKAFFCGPASMVIKMAKGIDIYNPLHLPIPKKTGKTHILQTTLELKLIKNICRVHLDLSFHSVLLAVLAGGIRNYLLANGHKIPFSPVRVGLPIPKPGHTYKLRNEYLVALVDLPVNKKTPRERLFACEKKLLRLQNDSFVPFMLQTWGILGMFPARWASFLTLKSAHTVVYSEIKGPTTMLTVTDETGVYQLQDLVFSFGLGPDDLYFAFNSLSYNGKIHIVISLDHGVAKTRENAESMLSFIEKEIDALQYGDCTNL